MQVADKWAPFVEEKEEGKHLAWVVSWLQEFRFSAFIIGFQCAAAPAVISVVHFCFVPHAPACAAVQPGHHAPGEGFGFF